MALEKTKNNLYWEKKEYYVHQITSAVFSAEITMKFKTVYGMTTFYNIEAYVLNGIQNSSDISEELKYILYFRE